jgi:hypothetical protein
MGFFTLPPMYLPRVHSREPKLPSDRRRQVPVLVPPSWFRTTSTVFSALELRVCCTPQPAEGSLRFVFTDPWEFARRLTPLAGIPAVHFAPSEEFPSSAAGHASLRAVAFLSLPSCPARGADRSQCACRPHPPPKRRGVHPLHEPGKRLPRPEGRVADPGRPGGFRREPGQAPGLRGVLVASPE